MALSRVAACAGVGLAAAPWRRRRAPSGPLRCEGPRPFVLGREAFISGREFTDVHTHYAFSEQLGEGGFGKVVLATHKRTGVRRAIKVIPKRDNAEDVKNEIRALAELDHPHIVKLVECFEDDARFYLVEGLCDGPDLAGLISSGALPERDVSIILRGCLKAVAGCHAHGFIHRDIKLENFMVCHGVVQMIDFGLAARYGPGGELTEVTGTHLYRAPEMFAPRRRLASRGGKASELPHGYNKPVDIWSMGVVMFALLTGESLFKLGSTPRAVQDRLVDPGYVQDRLRHCQALKACCPEARDLLAQMLQHDPRERITTVAALQHPFILRFSRELLHHDEHAAQLKLDASIFQKMATFARMPRLRQIAILAMAHRASEQLDESGELHIVRQTFRFLDQDGDGQISMEELRRLESHGIPLPDNLQEMFEACDLCGSGFVNQVEFVACCLPPAKLSEQLCTEAFMILDRNFSGELDAEDLQLLAKEFQVQECKAILHEAEAVVRGTENVTGRLTFEEFHRFIRGSEATIPPRPQVLHT